MREPVSAPAVMDGNTALSAAQRRLWHLHRRLPGAASQTQVVVESLAGPVDVTALRIALGAVVRRHESLRWRISDRLGEPDVVVDPPGEAGLPVHDLGRYGGDVVRAVDTAVTEARQTVDLGRGPLWRTRLLRLDATHHVLAVAVHPLVCDTASLAIVWRDLGTAYRQAVAGQAPLTDRPRAGYADYVSWRARDYVTDPGPGSAGLAGVSGVLELPRDRARPPVQTYHAAQAAARLPAHVAAALRRGSADLGVPPGVVALAAFGVLLRRWSGQADLVVGLCADGRGRPEFADVVGNFVELRPVRLRVDDDASFAALVPRVDAAVAAAMAARDAPLERVAERLGLPHDLSRAPLIQVAFEPSAAVLPSLDLPGVTARRLPVPPAGSPFDLTLRVVDLGGDGITLHAVHNPDLYRPERIDALLASYAELVSGFVADPDRPVLAVPARPTGAGPLPDPARPLPTAVEPAEGVLERIRRQVAERPDALAVSGEESSLTYAELDRLRAAVGAAVSEAGVAAGQAVGVLATRSPYLPAVLLGVLGSGARWLLLDPALPPDRLARQAAAAGLRALVACPDAAVPPGLATLPVVPVTDLAGSPGTDLLVPAAERGYLMATSGTTGDPALVTMTEAPLARFLAWYPDRFGIGAPDTTALLAGLAHDALLRDVLAPLVVGGRVCVPPQRLMRDPEGLLVWLAAARVTVAHLTPQLARLLTRAAGTLPDLRLVVLAGDLLTDADVLAVHRTAPNAVVVNAYGATETPQIHAYAVARRPTGDSGHRCPVPVGVGVPGGSELVLLGPGGTPAAVGELAEVHVRGPNLATGYLDPSAARDGFRRNPFTADDNDRVYATGDLGRYDPDGAVVLAGRADHQVKVLGYRVELGEVAAALREHPDVAEAEVVARPDPTGETRLTGYVVPRRAGLSVKSLREAVSRRLPGYARPAALVLLPTLPLTPGGKLDRAALPDPPADRPPESAAAGPATDTERRVAAVWREVLGLPHIAATDNFFDIGGHSLSIVAVHARLAGPAGRRLHLVDLFRYPTVRALAAHLDGAGTALGIDRAARRVAARRRQQAEREQR